MRGTAVEGYALDPAMRRLQDRPAWCLVDAARFHADETVFDQIEAPDPVLAAKLVETLQQGRRREPCAVDRNRVAELERDLDILRRIRCCFRSYSPAVDEFFRLDPRIFQDLALGRDMQKVSVDRKRRL